MGTSGEIYGHLQNGGKKSLAKEPFKNDPTI